MPTSSPIRLKDVAKRAGVSVSAVSLALRNRPKISVSERARIRSIAEELGYHPDPEVARLMSHLKKRRIARDSGTLALIVPGYFKNGDRKIRLMIDGATTRARDHGYAVETFWPRQPPGMGLRRLRSMLVARGIEGLLLGPMLHGEERLEFDFSSFSVAAMGYSMAEPAVHRAAPNHFDALRRLFSEIARRGFRRIGLIQWERMETGFNHLLSAAYLQSQSHLPPANRLEILYPEKESARLVLRLETLVGWLRKVTPEVVIAPGAAYRLLLEAGYRIPEDIGFVNLDVGDRPFDATGFVARYDLVGSAAADLLISQMNLNLRGVPAHPQTVLVPSTWQPGPTLGHPRP